MAKKSKEKGLNIKGYPLDIPGFTAPQITDFKKATTQIKKKK